MTSSARRDPAFFDNHARETVATSRGACELPILYQEASLLTAIWRVDAKRAQPLVPADFEPWLVFGKALAMLCIFEYRQTSIGPYGEIGLGVLVRRRGTKPSLLRVLGDLRKEEDQGLYVINLPVTTEEARAAGVEIWGYPKYVRDIDTRFTRDEVRVELAGELRLTMGKGRTLRTRGLPFVTYSVSGEDRLLRTVVDIDHDVRWGAAGTVDLKILGEGPTSKTVRALGIEGVKPAFAFRTDDMRSVLPRGKDMGAANVSRSKAPAPGASTEGAATEARR
jgi:Acetoacetate decarboxylase (ADC)